MKRPFLLVAAGLLGPGTAIAGCGTAFCSVNTGWSMQGVQSEPGLKLDLRHEWIRQDRPRTGTRVISVGEIPRHHDEVRTDNRNTLATLDYGFNDEWGLAVTLPYTERHHEHMHNHRGARLLEQWDISEIGDVRAVARHTLGSRFDQYVPSAASWGLNFGVKLPTARFDVRNAGGGLAERTLQPGTGTTDAILGAWYQADLPVRALSWFAQLQFQAPLRERQGYKPGKQTSADAALYYAASDRLGLMLQGNLQWRGRDSGAQAEPEDSGMRAFSVSPGISYAFSRKLQVYSFVQKPLYQRVNGVQLTAAHAVLVGANVRF